LPGRAAAARLIFRLAPRGWRWRIRQNNFPAHIKTPCSKPRGLSAFTLIELPVVIAIA
jgi:hypothetical protein